MKRILLILLFLMACAPAAYPQSQALKDMTATTAPAATDILYVVINPSGSAANRKLTIDNLFLSRTGNKNITAYASLSAAVTAISTNPAVVEIPATTTVSASLTIPANITLMPTGPGMISVSAGQTLTVNGPLVAPLRQIFTGAGLVRLGKFVDESFPQWFGAAGDGTTDDAAAVQKAYDAFTGTGDVLRAGVVKIVSGTAIGSTITCTLSGVIIEGTGWGAHADSTRPRGYVRWIGTTSSPMFLFQDCVRAGVRNIRIIGKSSGTKPSAAIQFNQSVVSTMDQPVVEDVWIGSYYSSDTDTGIQFTTGILFTGSTNIDTGTFKNISIQQAITGVDIQNPNGSVQTWTTLSVGQCTTGFKTVAPQQILISPSFYLNDVDFLIAASGVDLQLYNYVSEGSGRMAVGTAAVVRFFVNGGGIGLVDAANGGKFHGEDRTGSGKRWLVDFSGSPSQGLWVEIRNFTISQVGTPATPVLYMGNQDDDGTPEGATHLSLILDGVKGITSANFDVGTDNFSASSRYVVFNRQSQNSSIPSVFTRYVHDGHDTEDRAYQDQRFDIPGKATIYGGPLKVKRLAAPDGVSVVATGGSGTTYGYRISALTYDGETLASTTVTVSGGATLSGSVYNTVAWNPVQGAYAYKIYGRTNGSELLIKTFTVAEWGDTYQAQWRDTGALTPSSALPTINTTGNLAVYGTQRLYRTDDGAGNAEYVETAYNASSIAKITSGKTGSGTARALKLDSPDFAILINGADAWGVFSDKMLYPGADNQHNLGSGSFRVKEGYFGTGIVIGGTAINSKAVLELTSTTKGFLPPRMTTTERDAITSPPAGLMIYNTTTNKLNFYNGSAWEAVTSS